MASQIKPLKPYGVAGPNPPKVIMALEELGLPYETVETGFNNVKSPEYLAINPNGRIPALQDPNTDLTIWESGAILEYLVERYDKDHKISFPAGSNEAALARQWLFFQVSGQGPYYGQAIYFTRYQPLPAAAERFVKEINRISAVLESHLAKQKGNVADAGTDGDGPWLVGDRYSYADLSFCPWQSLVIMIPLDPEVAANVTHDPNAFPNVKKWLANMTSRPAVSKGLDRAIKALKK